MMPAKGLFLSVCATILGFLLLPALLPAQDPQPSKFYDIQISKDEIYSYTNLKFTGDYTTFDSPKGFLALGKTEEGITIVMILGEGTVSIEAPEAVQEKFKTVFAGYPLRTAFKSIYMRLHPKEYAEIFGKQSLSKAGDDNLYASAKQLFDDSFMRSYHAGAKAIFPPYKTRVIEFNTAGLGLVTTEEGYWLYLRRYAPYGSVYPRDFVNPKQK